MVLTLADSNVCILERKMEQGCKAFDEMQAEISELKEANTDLKYSLQRLNAEYEKLRADSAQKLCTLEGDNKKLMLAVDEMKIRNKELEQNVFAGQARIEDLKRHLEATEKRLLEAEKRQEEAKELKLRDEIILKLEEENNNCQDQLKWKNEQFKHLEDAHVNLQGHFQWSKEDSERGKLALIEEITSLQTGLDSQSRISDAVQSRLEMCNQALAQEESKRKLLEAQLSEHKSRFDDVFEQCQKEKMEIQSMTAQRDREIENLRISLGIKELLAKEREYKIVRLEQENKELGESLKELQEDQIRNGGSNSLERKLRKQLRDLEKAHNRCSVSLKEKELEWDLQKKKMESAINVYESQLKDAKGQIEELLVGLESRHEKIYVLKAQITLLLIFFKSEFLETCSRLSNVTAEKELIKDDNEAKIVLAEQPLMKSTLGKDKEQQVVLDKGHYQQRKLLEVSTDYPQMKDVQADNEADNALRLVKLQLDETIQKVKQLENELERWKCSTKNLSVRYEKSEKTCKEIETTLQAQTKIELALRHERESLVSVVKEKDKRIEDMQNLVASLECRLAAKLEELEALIKEKEILRFFEEKDACVGALQQEVVLLKQEQESIRNAEAAVLAKSNEEKAFEQEKCKLLEILVSKEESIKHLEVLVTSLEQDIKDVSLLYFTQVMEKEIRVNALTEALGTIENNMGLEIEEKCKINIGLGKEIISLCQKVAYQKESLIDSEKRIQELLALLEAKKCEIEKLMNDQRSLQGIAKEFEYQKGILLQDRLKLSDEREDILLYLEAITEKMGELSWENTKLGETLDKMLQNFDMQNRPAVRPHSIAENAETSVATAKKADVGTDRRSILKEINRGQI